jgi:adenylate cyclase
VFLQQPYSIAPRHFRLICWLLLLLASPVVAWAQPSDDDDINLSLIDDLLDRARYTDSDAEKEQLANRSLLMAKSARYESGMLRSYLILGEVSARSGRSEKSLRHYLEAEDLAISSKNLVALPGIYQAMGDLFFSQKLYTHASKYYELSLSRAPNNEYTIEKAADAALYSMRYDSAEMYYKVLITKFRDERNNPHLVQIYQKLAAAFFESGNYGKSLLYYLRIEDIVSRFGEPFEKGRLYNNLGKVYATLGDFQKSIDYFAKTEVQCQFAAEAGHGCETPEVLYINMGIALHNIHRTKEGLEYLFRAQAILLQRNDMIGLSSLEHIIATVYSSAKDHYNALSHNDAAIKYAKSTQQNDVLKRAYSTASKIYLNLNDYEKALYYYGLYFTLENTANQEDQRQRLLLTERSSQLRASESEIRFLLAQQEIKERDLKQFRYEQEKLEKSNALLAADAQKKELEVQLLYKQTEVDQATVREKTALALQAQGKLSLAAQALETERQSALIDKLKQTETIERAEKLASEGRVALLRKEKEFVDMQLSATEEFERNTYIIGGLGALVLIFMAVSWWYARRTGRRLRLQNQKIEAQKNQIENERSKSDRLLRNILPEEIADELKTRGYADPKLYDSATVLFTDFVNFTKLSENLPPGQIISELDECFLAFDEIIDRHGLEKIKTIGDAFMCAGGLPIANETHASDAVRAALEINQWLKQRNELNPKAVFREMRVGIHTGQVVAGVIGKNKFAYDIWGDAVNLASRLEEQGENGRVNISQTTYNAVKHQFECSWRGQREVHNKGLVDMYFIEREL